MSDERPQAHASPAPPRARGVIALVPSNCTSCMLCVRECPDWCISLEAHPEVETPAGGGRPRTTLVLDRFAIDYGQCMYCGICVEVCPFDALHWAPAHDYPAAQPVDLVHELDRLAAWQDQVPPSG